MSVLIKGMEMPRSCDECELCTCYVREDGTEENYRCVITFYPIHEFDKKHEYCPLVEIPPHGKWEKHDDGIMFWWECSECHQDPWYDREELYDYCPSCGAKMEFGESEEE